MNNLELQFNQAYQEYSDALLRYCVFKVSNYEVARDLLQETFYKTWRYLKAGNKVDNIRAFLYKILGNLIIDEYRKRGPDASLEKMEDEDGFDPGFDDTERWIDSIDGTQVLGLLQEIRAPYRDMLFMRYVKGLTIPEIAELSDMSKNTVAVRIHRGHTILQQLFNDHNLVHA